VRELRKLASDTYVNHLILLTDGHTYGDAEDCLELARLTSEQGLGFSAFGIGTEWNDVFLDALVAPSGGRTAYISSPQHILRQLQARIQGLGEVYAHNVRLRIDLPDGVALREGFKVSPYAQPVPVRMGEIALGAIEGKAPLICLLEINVQPQPAGGNLYFPVQLLANMPNRAEKSVSLLEDLTIPVVARTGNYTPSRRIVEAVRALNFYRMNEDAINAVANGEVGLATERMRHLTQRLRDAGHTTLADHAEKETRRIAQQGRMSPGGQKELRYGTRALASRDIAKR
jgi:Ca-activated chloride channel family protein